MPKVFDPITDDDMKKLDALKGLWDQIQDRKEAYDRLLADLSGHLSSVQISRFTGLPRQRIMAQICKTKREETR